MPKSSSYLPGFFQDFQASPLSYGVIASSSGIPVVLPRDSQVLFGDAVSSRTFTHPLLSYRVIARSSLLTRFLPGLSRIPVVVPSDSQVLFADAVVVTE
jgi:hypothetical protein